jgi:hypothetical protein
MMPLCRASTIAVTAVLTAASLVAVGTTLSTAELFRAVQQRPDDMARYRYLLVHLPGLPPAERNFVLQLLASTENELGLYSEAVRDFPMQSVLPAHTSMPSKPEWEAVDAVDGIAELAAGRRIVMVNELHHDAHTRALTLALLPRLRHLGFNYFAAEAINGHETSLSSRGYAIVSSGSEYLHEPLYGDIVREAIRLGYEVVPYESDDGIGQAREDDQASHLYQRVFAHDPNARLFVHAGYAHIDKAPGRLGPVVPMAVKLQQLTGITPLSIDQVDVHEDSPSNEYYAALRIASDGLIASPSMSNNVDTNDLFSTNPGAKHRRSKSNDYYALIRTYQPIAPVLFRHRNDSRPWSARPDQYDVNVILPPGNEYPSDYRDGPLQLTANNESFSVVPPAAGGRRPNWLSLEGTRIPSPITSDGCAGSLPCLVEAHYANEPDHAIAADRYLFINVQKRNVLYLRPGRYRIRYLDADGRKVQEQTVDIAAAH